MKTTFAEPLLPGEHVLWSGQPAQGLLFLPRDVYLIPFSLLWCGFAVFWEFSVAGSRAPGFFLLWGAAFVCLGLYFVAGRFVFDALVRRRMVYAVTDSRVIIRASWPTRKLLIVNLRQMPNAQLEERADGSGTIRFGDPLPLFGNRGLPHLSPALEPPPQLLMIEHARQVFDLIQSNIPYPGRT